MHYHQQLSRSLDVLKFNIIVDDSFFPFDRVHFRSAFLPKTGSMQPFFRLNCNISKMAAERDSEEMLSSGEGESRNVDEYLDDCEAENEKMSVKRKSKKKTSSRKH